MTPSVAWVLSGSADARAAIRAAGLDDVALAASLAALAEVTRLALAACDKSSHAAAQQKRLETAE